MRSNILLSRMSFVLSLLIATSVALGPGAPAREKEESVDRDPRGKILWANKEKQRAMFIPQSLLQRPLDELPLDESSLRGLEHRLEVQRHPELFPEDLPAGRVAKCRQRSTPSSMGSASKTMDLATLLVGKDVVWIGTIVDLESGVDPRLVAAVEAAYVRLDEIVRLRPGARAPSSQWPMVKMFGGARVSIGGTVLCDEELPGFYQPRVGDRLLLGGTVLPEEPRVFQGEVFPLEGNTVRLQPFSFLEPDSGPRDLGALKSRLEEVAQERAKP